MIVVDNKYGVSEVHIAPAKKVNESNCLLALAGVVLANEWDDMWDEAVDKQEDIASRVHEITKTLYEKWCENQYPHMVSAIDQLKGCDVPQLSCDTSHRMWRTMSQVQFNVSGRMETRALRKYKLESFPEDCDNELSLNMRMAAADAGLTLFKRGQIREKSRTQLRWKALSAAYKGSQQDPGPIFGLMSNAAQIHQNMQIRAAEGFNGALSMFGYGMTGGGTF